MNFAKIFKNTFFFKEHLRWLLLYGIQQFQSLQDLDTIIELGQDRQLWKHLCNDIFEATQAD